MELRKVRKKSFDKGELNLLKRVGRRISENAAKRKISIERLAYEAGVSKGYLYDVTKGVGNPSVIILSRIASALDVPTWMLLK